MDEVDEISRKLIEKNGSYDQNNTEPVENAFLAVHYKCENNQHVIINRKMNGHWALPKKIIKISLLTRSYNVFTFSFGTGAEMVFIRVSNKKSFLFFSYSNSFDFFFFQKVCQWNAFNINRALIVVALVDNKSEYIFPSILRQ